jgi:hypothetical protein
MIGNFDEVKKQLSELSEVINKFKSEAVQLRIVEIVAGQFAGGAEKIPATEPLSETKPGRRRKPSRKRSTPSASPTEEAPKATTKTKRTGQGATTALLNLVEESFFSQPKTISDIVNHCEEKLARRFKPNEFSGKLARLTRDGTLDRKKNGDNQYEYTKK